MINWDVLKISVKDIMYFKKEKLAEFIAHQKELVKHAYEERGKTSEFNKLNLSNQNGLKIAKEFLLKNFTRLDLSDNLKSFRMTAKGIRKGLNTISTIKTMSTYKKVSADEDDFLNNFLKNDTAAYDCLISVADLYKLAKGEKITVFIRDSPFILQKIGDGK